MPSMVLLVLYLIYIMAGIIQWSDNNPGNQGLIVCERWDADPICPKTIFQSIYMSITTVATVGYGDVVAVSVMSKMLVSLMMLVVFIMIPQKVRNNLLVLCIVSVMCANSIFYLSKHYFYSFSFIFCRF